MSAGCCGAKKTKLNGGPQMARETQSGIEQPLRTSIRHCSHSTTAKGQKCGYPYGHLNPTSGRNRAVCCYNGSTPTTNGTLRNGLIPIASAEMCFYCFDVLYSHLHNMETPSTPDFTNEPFPLFVTWKVGKDKRLRGCMGTFSHINLHAGLREYAATSSRSALLGSRPHMTGSQLPLPLQFPLSAVWFPLCAAPINTSLESPLCQGYSAKFISICLKTLFSE